MTKNKVLITGGAGFIGSHIVEKLLENNYNVIIIDNLSSGFIENIPNSDTLKFYQLNIEKDDFMENPPSKYYRLFPGNEVRLRNAYFVKCEDVIKDDAGNIVEVRCTYDPETKSGTGFTGRKVKGTIHWVSATHNVKASVRLYDYLFVKSENDEEGYVYNANSLKVLDECYLEKSFEDAKKDDKYQFNRHGYFVVDTKDTTENHLVFNRIVSLKDSFNKK